MAGMILALAAENRAQEAIRMSLAGQMAAEARRETALNLTDYNLKWGPTYWQFHPALSLAGRDNVRLTEKDREADLLFRPLLNARLWWPLSEKNSLNLVVGAGYTKYLKASDLDALFLGSGSEVSFDLYLGGWVVNVHDRFSIPMESYEIPTFSRGGSYERLENAAGVVGDCDLNKLRVTLGYDHLNYYSLNSNYRLWDGQGEVLFARAGYALASKTVAGFETGVSLADYSESLIHDGLQYNAGLFYEGQLSQYIRVRASAGYTSYDASSEGLLGTGEDADAIYAQISLTHRLNQKLTYTLSAGHDLFAGLRYGNGRVLDYWFARLHGHWSVVRDGRIVTQVFYSQGSEFGALGDDFAQVGGSILFRRKIGRKFTGSVGYSIVSRGSQFSGRDYLVNSVFLTVGYGFW
jgi:hypothetical protein